MKYLVTGAAGFIGAKVSERLCIKGHEVIGIDNLNDYYDVNLKYARLDNLKPHDNFTFIELDLTNREGIAELFVANGFERVIHLAAQVGVRYSIDNPMIYADSNLIGHLTILEGCRQHKIKHLVYASSSSVYGLNSKMPFSTDDSVDHPISLYAATKKANELMSHTYSHLYGVPTTGLRFFTVYGPWGRPDMALFKFTKAIMNGDAIDVYNHGNLSRDFTYIDDIVEGIIRIQDCVPRAKSNWSAVASTPANSSAPYRVFNIGNGQPVKLMDFISALEKALGKPAIKNMMEMQPGDVHSTWADTEDLFNVVGYLPHTDVETGVQHFVDWYKSYYKLG
ncbi:MAG: NAD-dependent epimerase [Shewanella sp.]